MNYFTYELWPQDLGNCYIANRDNLTFGYRNNELFPQEHSSIRDIVKEGQLFTIANKNRFDCFSPCETNVLESSREVSNRELYRRYHQHEIHSPCYPNQDKSVWNNITKAKFAIPDNRNTVVNLPFPTDPLNRQT